MELLLKAAIEDLKRDINSLPANELKNKLSDYERTFAEFEQAAQQAGVNNNSSQDNSQTPDDGPINA